MTIRREDLDQILEHRAQPSRDLHVGRPAGANLGARDVNEVLPVRRAEDHARLAGGIQHDVGPQVPPPEHAQQSLHLVDREHGRRRIVDRRRERLEPDVDQDAEGEHRILLERPLGSEGHVGAQRLVGDRRRATVQHEQRLVGRDEVADLRHELDHAVVLPRQGDERRQIDRQHDLRPTLMSDEATGRAELVPQLAASPPAPSDADRRP